MEELPVETEETPAQQDWKNPPSLQDLKDDLEGAKNDHDAQVTKIQSWLDNLNVEGSAKLKNIPAGNSTVQPKLIRKQAEWRYTALSEPFLSTEDMFSVAPVTWEDADAARQNQLVLNNQINTKINKIKFIDELVRSAVNKGTAIVRVGWAFQEEEFTEVRPVYDYRVNPELGPLHEELHAMMEMNPTGYKFEVPEEMQKAHELSMEQGQPLEAFIAGQEEVTEMRTVRNCPTLDICDFRNVTLDPSCEGDVDKAGFVVYSYETSLSELRKAGRYYNLDSINLETSSSPLGDPDHDTEEETNFQFKDDTRKKFVAHEYWGFWDFNETGIAEPFVATWVGSTIIRMEATPFPDKKLPFVFIPYMPEESSAYGEPDGELLTDNQRIVGAVTRGMVDILGKSANGQTGSRKDALDVTNRRKYEKGLDYEYNAHVDPNAAFFMHKFNEIPQSAPYLLNQQNMEAESMTGVKTFSDGINGNQLGEVVAGIRGALDASSKRETGLLRRLAKGMCDVGRKIISMNGEFLEEEEVVRITNGQFVPIRRDDLSGNFDLKLIISTAEEDNAKAQELAFMLQTMGNNMDFGMTQIILRDIARLRKMPELAHSIENFKPEPDPVAQQMQQMGLQKLQLEMAEIESKIQENYANAGLDQARAQEVIARARLLGSQADQSDLDFVEQEAGVTQERELQKQGEQARGNIALEREKQKINNVTELEKYTKRKKP